MTSTQATFRLTPQEFDPAIPVAKISEYPDNPNVGDTENLAESLDEHGFFGAVLVHKATGHIIAGNHRYRMAVKAGATELPGFWVDVDAEQAAKILAEDNASTRRGTTDTARMFELLKPMTSLRGTGYNLDDLDSMADLMGANVLTGAATGAGWAETEEEEAARRARVEGYGDRKQAGAMTEMILVYTVDERTELAALIEAARARLGDAELRGAEVILRACRVLAAVLDPDGSPLDVAALAELAGQPGGADEG